MVTFDGEIADGHDHDGRYSAPREPRGGLGEAQRSRRPEKAASRAANSSICCQTANFRRSRPSRSVLSRRAGRARSGSQTSIRLTVTASPGEGDGGVAGFAKGAAKGLACGQRWGARSCPTTLSHKSGWKARPARPAPHQQRAAKKTADDFFEKFRAAVTTDSTATSTQTVHLEPTI